MRYLLLFTVLAFAGCGASRVRVSATLVDNKPYITITADTK